MKFVFDDGGAKEAGYKVGRDCVARAVAIASGKPYKEVRGEIRKMSKGERRGTRKRGISSPRTGVYNEE